MLTSRGYVIMRLYKALGFRHLDGMRTPEQLARLLGLQEGDLLTRAEAAAFFRMTKESFRNIPTDVKPGFYKLGSHVNATALFRRDWLIAYQLAKSAGLTPSEPEVRFGEQPWPTSPADQVSLEDAGNHPMSDSKRDLMLLRWGVRQSFERVEEAVNNPEAAQLRWRRETKDIRASRTPASSISYEDAVTSMTIPECVQEALASMPRVTLGLDENDRETLSLKLMHIQNKVLSDVRVTLDLMSHAE